MSDCETAWKKQQDCVFKARTGEISCEEAKAEINRIRNIYDLPLIDPITLVLYQEINKIIWERENCIRYPSIDPINFAIDIEKTKRLRTEIQNNNKKKHQIKKQDVRISKKGKKECF
jgi:hypothetical protein